MSAGGSTKVIIISLCANLGIAIAKLGGALYTASSVLMAEAVHSFADCGNQVLLLYGQRAARRPVSARHPLGLAKASFFWSFMVALLLFSMGGMFSLYEGWHKFHAPEPLNAPIVGVIILLIGIALEGYSMFMCYREVQARNVYPSLWQWIRRTTDADLLVIFLEDFAALLGLSIALITLGMGWITGNPAYDAVGSMLIGVLLITVAILLANEVKSLLMGEAPEHDYRADVEQMLAAITPTGRILNFIAIQRGVGEVVVAYKFHPGTEVTTATELIGLTNRLEAAVKERFPEIKWQFAEPDLVD